MNENSKQPLYLELPEVDCRRQAFRIEPDEEMPAFMLIEGSNASIKNLSATGVAFYLGDILKPPITANKKFSKVPLYLGGEESESLLVDIEILKADNNLFRCQLQAPDHNTQMAICRYIVEHQKTEIRKQKALDSDHKTTT